MTKDQTTGIIERVIYGLAMAVLAKLVAKGYIDQDMAAYVAGGVVTAVGAVWGWWVNRPQALMQAAVNSAPGTKIVTEAKLANSIPDENITSNIESKVVRR